MSPIVRFFPNSPYLLLVLTMLFWSGNFVLGRAVRELFTPLTLSFWRWATALVLLLPFTLPQLRTHWPVIRQHWKALTLLSVLGVVNFNTFAYLGLQHTMATNAVIMLSITPVLIVALSFLLLRQRINRWQALGITVSLLGVLVIVARGDWHTLRGLQLNHGDLWVLMAVLSWALYSVCLRWRPTDLPPLAFLATTIAIGVPILLLLYLWDLSRGATLAIGPVTLASIAYVAIFPSILAYIFWNRAIAELGPNRAGQFLHLMPAFGAIESMIFLGERLYTFHIAGIVLIATGIYLATLMRR
ncbi:MAG: DMT family transporter [Gammaproteobacteria bacterium]|nr:DMT family transporter [Gammaproteobacteria bacterium]MCP5425700.1 DMT family transporter [Gammaproteobacteria bacterium]MCP5459731.1 DMT family transporter [Gammaproteobacteria bacterium]